MESTKKKALDRLVKNLGMQQEMSSLLDSDEDYVRFEESILAILFHYEGEFLPYRDSRGDYHRPRDLGEVDCFKRMYSIGFNEPEPPEEIAKRFFGTRYLTSVRIEGELIKGNGDWVDYHVTHFEDSKNWEEREKHQIMKSRKCAVGPRIDRVVKVLKQKHKADIWYGTLPVENNPDD